MADRSATWRMIAATVAMEALAITGLPRHANRYTPKRRKPAPSTPTSKRAKVKAARKQRQRNG